MYKALLATFLVLSTASILAEETIKGYSQLAKGQTEEGIRNLETSFGALKVEDKKSVAFILAQAEKNLQKNTPAYYAKYSLKHNPSLDKLSQAKLQRILGDELFELGSVEGATKAYERGLPLSSEEPALEMYIRYKLGWAYVNQNSYGKMFELWNPHLETEHILSPNMIHDYGKFWIEYALQKNRLVSVPPYSQKEAAQFQRGLIDGMQRDFKKDLKVAELLKSAPSQKEKNFFLSSLFLEKRFPACQKLTYLKETPTLEGDLFDKEVIKAFLDECLELSLKTQDQSTLVLLEEVYDRYQFGLKERAILALQKADAGRACTVFKSIFQQATDASALSLASEKQENLGCLADEKYLADLKQNLLANFHTWPEEVKATLLGQRRVARVFLEALPSDWKSQPEKMKLALLKGLEGEAVYLDYSLAHIQSETSLLTHFSLSNDVTALRKALGRFTVSPKTRSELELLVALKAGLDEDVQSLAGICKGFSPAGVSALLDYIIEKRLWTTFEENISCFESSKDLESKCFLAAMAGPFSKETQSPFFNYVNAVLFKDIALTKPAFDKRLQDEYPSVLSFKKVKTDLGHRKDLRLEHLPRWDSKVLAARKQILKTEWMNERIKALMIEVFNGALDEATTKIRTLNLKVEEQTLLIERYEGLKFR